MVSCINQNPKVFSDFPVYKNQGTLTTAKKTTTPAIGSSDSVLITAQKKKKKKMILFGSTIASTIFTAGILAMVLTKGIHGSSLSKFKTNVLNDPNFTDKAVLETQKTTHKVLNFLDSLSNGTAIKDRIADKILRVNKYTAKFADYTTSKFKKIVDKTLGKKYDKVEVKVRDLSSVIKHCTVSDIQNASSEQLEKAVTIKGETHTLSQWLQKLSEQSSSLEQSFDDGFSLGARKVRNAKRSKLISGIGNKVNEKFFGKGLKSLFNPKNYNGYVTEEISADAKKELAKDILSAKKKVTNNITAIHTNISDLIETFKQSVDFHDDKTLEAIKTLKFELQSFKECSGENEVLSRQKIVKNISEIISSATNNITESALYSDEQKKTLIHRLQKIGKSSQALDEKGALEEIMTIVNGLNKSQVSINGKKIVSDSQLKEYSKLASSISKGLKDATATEAEQYFVKAAEMEVGSAPTDVLSILFPIGAGAYAIGKSDNKDERISATLTTCIPLVGTFATFVYGTTKMMYGAKNLALSLGSGILLSKLGNYCDKLYKNYKDSGSVVKVAQDEYNNIKNDFKFEQTKN